MKTKSSGKSPAAKTKSEKYEFRIKRVYDKPAKEDGFRFLVDRLWPRGIKKSELPLTDWIRDVAPSPELRKWFGHEPSKLAEFRKCYQGELEANPVAWKPLKEAVRTNNVTLLFAARDMEINHAVVLKEYLEKSAARDKKA